MPWVWYIARYGPEFRREDVVAARAALGCGLLGELQEAIHAPLTMQRFVKNIWVAVQTARLRIPVDPVVAKMTFCR